MLGNVKILYFQSQFCPDGLAVYPVVWADRLVRRSDYACFSLCLCPYQGVILCISGHETGHITC